MRGGGSRRRHLPPAAEERLRGRAARHSSDRLGSNRLSRARAGGSSGSAGSAHAAATGHPPSIQPSIQPSVPPPAPLPPGLSAGINPLLLLLLLLLAGSATSRIFWLPERQRRLLVFFSFYFWTLRGAGATAVEGRRRGAGERRARGPGEAGAAAGSGGRKEAGRKGWLAGKHRSALLRRQGKPGISPSAPRPGPESDLPWRRWREALPGSGQIPRAKGATVDPAGQSPEAGGAAGGDAVWKRLRAREEKG